MKRLVLAALAVLGMSGTASADVIREYTLFGGSNTDSTEQVSTWIPVRHAKRVYIRTWTTKAAFHASTDADSTRSDSLTTFRVLLSDSICCQLEGPNGQLYASAGDSIFLPVTITGDTAKAMAAAYPLPINKELRGASNGSGLITVIWPVRPGSVASTTPVDESGMIIKGFLRVMVTPLRRLTVTGFSSTQGIRVNGLKGLKMVATVVSEQ